MVGANLTWLLFLHSPILHFHEYERYYPTTVENLWNDTRQPMRGYGSARLLSPDTARLWYAFLYPINDAYFYLAGRPIGKHVGDLEFIIAHVDTRPPFQMRHVFLSAHSFQQGTWVDNPQTPLYVYVALGSHAMYPRPETYQRNFGITNDQCSVRGLQWKAKIDVIAEQWWTAPEYADLLLGTASLPNTHYMFAANESLESYGDSWMYRYFYPFFAAFDNS